MYALGIDLKYRRSKKENIGDMIPKHNGIEPSASFIVNGMNLHRLLVTLQMIRHMHI